MPTTDQQKIIEIRVRYDQAVQGIAKYTQAINQLKTEQQQLKAELKQGTITEQQYNTAMAQNREQVKTYQADIRALSREFQNNVKEQRENEGSLVSLRAQLSKLTTTYDQLSREMRQGDFGESMRKQIMEVSQELKEAEAETNRFYRNVGNYASGFNGLNVSVQQILREMPNAAMSMNTFFLAISNNIPMLVDELNRLREANRAAAAEGKATTSIWKALSGAFFSWNTVISVGVTLLTVYGGEIVKWIANLFKGKDALDQIQKSQQEFNAFQRKMNEDWRNSVAQTAGENIAAYQKLMREYNALGNNMQAKEKFITDNQEAFHNLGFSVTGVTDAESLLVKNSDAVVNALVARAKAAAYEQQITDATQRYINQTEYNRSTVAGGGFYNRIRAGQSYITTGVIPELLRGLREGEDYILTTSQSLSRFEVTVAGAAKINAQRSKEAAERLKDNNEEARRQLDEVVNRATEGLEQQVNAEQSIYNELGITRYNGNGGGNGGGTVTSTTPDNIDSDEKALQERQQRELEEWRKYQDELYKLTQDTWEQRRQHLNAQYDREIEDIRRQLATEENLTVAAKESMNKRIEVLEQERNVELNKLSDEQLQQSIANEQQRIEYLLQAAGEDLEKQRALRQQQLEEEQQAEEMRIFSEFDNEAERNAQLEAMRAAFRQRMLDLNKEFDDKEKAQNEKAAAKALKIEQAKWDGAAKLTNAASQLIRNFGEDNKAMTRLAKTLALATVAINTGKAISEAIAANAGKPWGFAAIAGVVAQIMSAMASAIGIINSAKFATGGLVTGPGSGTSDSIPAMLSNGESVMTARSTSMFAPLLSSLNQLGGGVPITSSAPTQELGIDYLAAAVAKGMESMPRPVVSVEEISRVGNRVEVIERMGRV